MTTASNPSLTSRRHFLRTSGSAVAGGVLAANLILRQRAFAENSDTLKVGLVGCGGRGTGAAMQALRADKNVVLTAMGDAFLDKVKNSIEQLKSQADIADKVKVDPDKQFEGLDAYKKVIASGVDVVVLAAPPGFRPMHIKAAVEAGKHLFAEKPMATDAPGVRSVLASTKLAKEKKLAVCSGFCWRFDTARRELFQRIHDGAIGDLRAYHATYLAGVVKPMAPASERPAGMTDVQWQVHNWYNFTWLSGDGLVEQACHSVDKIAWAFNGRLPVKVVANGGRHIPNHEGNIYDHMDLFYEFDDGARAFMAQRQINGCHSENNDYILGGAGSALISGWNPPIIKGKDKWRYQGPKSDMYQIEHNELFASIRAGTPRNDGEWMAHSSLMAIMGRMAAYTGQEITWEQAMGSQEKLVPDEIDWNTKMPIIPMAVPGITKFA